MKQAEALDILKLGHNVYLTGAAGAGKTYVLNQFISYLKESGINVGVTASTGIAATHMNGMTIHAWAGLGVADSLGEINMEKLLQKSQLKKRLRESKVLIIDEVSMLHGKRLDMVDAVCRAFKDASKPFGGLQVVLCGDLFQLPPVTRGGPVDFVFQSKAWSEMNLKICYIDEQHRQEDQVLLDVLNAIRGSTVDDSHFEYLQQRFLPKPKERLAVRLYTHNADVDDINVAELSSLPGATKRFTMTSSGNKRAAEGLVANCLAPEMLELKQDAEVMFVANNQNGAFVNGTLGRVVGFADDDTPIVKTADRTVYVQPHTWKLVDGDRSVAEVTQLPLRLAWAITVHKSQGMSLDCAEIDLEKSFEPGMGYVAISRVRGLEGLYIKGINNIALQVHPLISKFDKQLRHSSAKTEKARTSLTDEQINSGHEKVKTALQSDESKQLSNYDEAVFERLRDWRTAQAKTQSVPAYVILADKTLKLISSIKPKDIRELGQVKGIGPQKLERYGEELLEELAGLDQS